MKRARLALVLLIAVTLPLPGLVSRASAQAKFPAKPINIVVPYSPGGSSDLVARSLGRVASKYLGQPLVVMNKPGAAGTLGLNAVGDARPDGYTVGITNSGMILQPLVGQTKYNYATDLEAIAQAGYIPFVFAVRAEAPWKDLDEFTRYAKQHPGEIKYGHTGIGNTAHTAPEQYAKLAGVKIEPIPFDGGAPLIAALLGGHIQAIMNNPVDLQQHVKAGKIRVLAVADERRIDDPQYKEVPTFKEKGFPVYAMLWQGVGAPKGMPQDVKRALADGFKNMTNDPESRKAIVDMGLIFEYLGPEAFQKKWIEQQEALKIVLVETGILELIKSQKK
jgi:tripartite-type tricarboxylate transporter receptor subunit TctC